MSDFSVKTVALVGAFVALSVTLANTERMRPGKVRATSDEETVGSSEESVGTDELAPLFESPEPFVSESPDRGPNEERATPTCPGPEVLECVTKFVKPVLSPSDMTRMKEELRASCFSKDPYERRNQGACLTRPVTLGKDSRNGYVLVLSFGCSSCRVPQTCSAQFRFPEMPGPKCATGAALNSAYPRNYCMPIEFLSAMQIERYRNPEPHCTTPGDPICVSL